MKSNSAAPERIDLYGHIGRGQWQRPDPIYRAMDRFLVGDGCWEWTGAKMWNGYGKLGKKRAHVLIYETLIGPVPDGLELHHSCENRACVRPAHLIPCTHALSTWPTTLRLVLTARQRTTTSRRWAGTTARTGSANVVGAALRGVTVFTTSLAPERICLYGHEATGKTRAWADIATQVDGKVYVVNHEAGAIERLMDGYPALRDRVDWTDCRSWVQLVEATRGYREKAQAGDWIIVENSSRAWDAVQMAYEEHYAKQQGFASDDLFSTVPVDESPARWVKINQEYYRWIDALVDPATNPAHLLVTSPEKPVTVPQGKKGEWVDDKQTVALFSRLGMRPDSQKRLPHQMHTVLWLRTVRTGVYTFTSAKDRERELAEDAPMIQFPFSYLIERGGWSA